MKTVKYFCPSVLNSSPRLATCAAVRCIFTSDLCYPRGANVSELLLMQTHRAPGILLFLRLLLPSGE